MNDSHLKRLEEVRDILHSIAGPHDDTLAWAAQCLTDFLAQQGRITLDQAFGLARRRVTKGEQLALEVRRMSLRKPGITTAEKLERLRELGFDHDESNMFKYLRKHAADVEAQAVAEYLTERLNEADGISKTAAQDKEP